MNVWIALSPTTAEEGGGLAVAPGSHDPSGKGTIGRLAQKARRAIASNGARTTCFLDMLEPDCNAQMEQIKRVYDMQPGDAIIHDRYLFHKPDAFNENDIDNDNDNVGHNEKTVTKQRISLRYMPSDATFFDNGKDVDGAATRKNLKTGDPLWKAGEYFPQTWPCELEEERKANSKQDPHPFNTKLLFRLLKRKYAKA